MSSQIRDLVRFLSVQDPTAECEWDGWRIRVITGGRNNRLFRATRDNTDVAVKFTRRDERDRTGREYAALAVLQDAGLDIAPVPLMLDRDSLAQPAIVQSWLDGDVVDGPPRDDIEWERLLEHFALIHSVKPEGACRALKEAVVTAYDAEGALAEVRKQVVILPQEARSPTLEALVARLESIRLHRFAPVSRTLCRVDPNILNFIRRPGRWASVDWENAGWGNPAFEMAELTIHPAYIQSPNSKKDWLIQEFCREMRQPGWAEDIRFYRQEHAVWWVARLERIMYEVPRRLDRRMVEPEENWLQDTIQKHDWYVKLANSLFGD